MKKTRWKSLIILASLALVFCGFGASDRAQAVQGTPLPGSAIPQFIDPLPLLDLSASGTLGLDTLIAGASEIKLHMREFQATVMPSGFVPANGNPYTGTWVWGYVNEGSPYSNSRASYIGPVIVASRGTPTQIRFVNNLTTDNISWREWTDMTLHSGFPMRPPGSMDQYIGSPIAVPHLHGGEVPPVVDGGPDAWFSADGLTQGPGYYTHPGVAASGNESVYRYPNKQEAGHLWFHDHLLGGTRLNVYAGLAGAYELIDPGLSLPAGLHPVGLDNGGTTEYLVPMVIQDRMFDTNGQLYFPNVGINPEHPYWLPEFEGDTIVVNGKVWPFLNVEPNRYRFLFINGSNARAYELFLVNPVTKVMGPAMWQIGTDGGYLDVPVKIDPNVKPLDKLVLMPGERAGVIIDFAGAAGQTLLMRNTARHPYNKGVTPNGNTLGRIIQFRVGPGPVANNSYDPASGTPLRPSMVRLVNQAAGTLAAGVTADETRQLTLNEVMGAGGPLEILVNNTKWSGVSPWGNIIYSAGSTPAGDNYSEKPVEGTTEVWEIVNLTADAHPIHTHLTQFQLINRQNFNVNKYNKAYAAAFPGGAFMPAYGPPLDYLTGNARALGGNPDIVPYLQGPVRPPNPNEAGWKDTVIMYPGQVARIAIRYAPEDKPINDPDMYYPFDPFALTYNYVWHCHIVDHEDNEMMRPYGVEPDAGATRTWVQAIDY